MSVQRRDARDLESVGLLSYLDDEDDEEEAQLFNDLPSLGGYGQAGGGRQRRPKKVHAASHHGHSHAGNKKSKRCDGKAAAFLVIGVLTLVYCCGELGVAVYAGSLSLLSDGFHNLSDVVSLVVGWWASEATKRDPSDEMSFGWARTELLGALTNACFLLSLCLYIAMEAIPRFISPEHLAAPGMTIMITAGAGVALNTLGTIVFALTGHGHSHSHGGGGHGHSHGGGHGHSHGGGDDHGHAHGDEDEDSVLFVDDQPKKKKKKKKKDLNVHAVFLHYLGDMISSMFVLAVGILLHFFPSEKYSWAVYLDPASSLVIIGIILWTTVPLAILGVEGVLNLHDLHVWQLVDGMTIASVHVAVEEGVDFKVIVKHVKRAFHAMGIHSSSIQPEFVPLNVESPSFCETMCVEECKEDWCCKKVASKADLLADEDDHGHAHGLGDDHGHAHGLGDGLGDDHGHAHGLGDDHGHAHGLGDDHGHGHGEADGHGHSHGSGGGHGHSH